MNSNPTTFTAALRLLGGRHVWLLPLLITSLATTVVRGDAGDDAYKFAAGLYQNKRWELASGKFRTFVQSYPKHPKLAQARLYLGLSLVNQDKFAEARTELRQFVNAYPKSRNLADATYRIAECSYLLNDYPAAEKEFSQFLGLAPDHELAEWALPYLGDTLLQRKKMTLASAAFQESLKKHPDGRMADDARFGLARCYETLNRPREALAIYRMLAGNQTARHADRAQLKVAASHFAAGDFQDAAIAYDAVKKRFPDSPLQSLAAINAGYSYYQLRDFTKAIERFSQAEQDKKQAAAAGYWKALSYKSQGDYPQAIRILTATSKQYPKSDLADRIVYQLANSQLLEGRFTDATQSYIRIADRWPQSSLADDSLHFAAESSVYAEDLDQADAILKRIETDYPRSPLTKRNAILKGRIWQARGGSENIRRASQIFSDVVQTSQVAQTRALARLYLAQSLQTLQDHREAIRAIQPLVDALKDTQSNDHLEAFVLAAISHLALSDYAAANVASTTYLNRAPAGSKRERALATRAVAQAQLQQRTRAMADLDTLQTEFANSPIILPTLLKMSEATYAGQNWKWAQSLFMQLSTQDNPAKFRARGLSGWGWCQFQLKEYSDAAATFQQLIQKHPEHELTAEASYMRGQALQNAQRNAEATTAFLQTFERYAPQTPAAAGTEASGATRRAFEAGLAAAQLLESDGKIDEADTTYNRLAQVFPRAKGIDAILEHWAFLNLDAQKTDRADAIFKRLYTEHPNSERADNARLQLAESQFVAGNLDQARGMFQELLGNAKSDAGVRESSLFELLRIAVYQKQWSDALMFSTQLKQSFPNSEFLQESRFYHSEALVRTDKPLAAQVILQELKQANLDWEKHPWMPRVWAVLAESYFRQKQYASIDTLAKEFTETHKQALPYELEFFVGWSHIKRANWDQSRVAFSNVLKNPQAKNNKIGAQSQFLIGESWLAEEQFAKALEAYLAVTINHTASSWTPQALWQAGQCDERLKQNENAQRTYRKLIKEYPESPYSKLAKGRLDSL